MRINAHCHIFNLQSAFTQGTKNNLRNRLERTLRNFVFIIDPFLELLEKYLEEQEKGCEGCERGIDLKSPEGERAKLLSKFLDKDRDPKEAQLRAELLDTLRVMEPESQGLLGDFFDKLKDVLGVSLFDARLVQLRDIVEFVSVALSKNIDDVTDYLFDDMAEGQRQGNVDRGELIIFPLMMDILSKDWNNLPTDSMDEELKKDRREELSVFKCQIKGTLRQCLRYPGRVLPFYAVNPWRPNWYDEFKEAIEEGGFVGMKAYPSLGYEVKDIAKALKLCCELKVPVITHCNNGGFKASDETAKYCNPQHWRDTIDEFKLKDLRICFGHFGGGECFKLSQDKDDFLWAQEIIRMMKNDSYNVYADISYHSDGMSYWDEEDYFRWLKTQLKSSPGRSSSKVLFGTDFFLSLQRLSEDNHWDYFKDRLEEREFERITRKNPVAFVGLNPDQPEKSEDNILRHIEWLRKNQSNKSWGTGGKCANWLKNVKGLNC